MAKLFEEARPPPEEIRNDIPEQARSRILAVFGDLTDEHTGSPGRMLAEVGKVLFKEYGGLRKFTPNMPRWSDDPVIEHFFCCSDEEALDFVEACFQSFAYRGGQRGVDEINDIFREHGIGYELTPFVKHQVEPQTSSFGRIRQGTVIEMEFPRIIRRDHQLMHQEVIQPTLQLLTNSKLRVANAEMLKAHAAMRAGEFEDAITLCGSAFESVLKTICDLKKWPYDPDRDTCSKLVAICKDHGLFPSFYAPIFEATGSIRNKLGDAHGRGPKPIHTVTKEQADHAVQMTSAHILLVARLAKMQ